MSLSKTDAAASVVAPEAEAQPRLYGGDLVRRYGLLRILREDFVTHGRLLHAPGFWAIAVYRFGAWSRGIRLRPVRLLFRMLYWMGYLFVRNFCGIELRDTMKIGRRLHIGHQSGIVIHEHATIGDDCTILQNVTFGAGVEWTPDVGPVIGDRVSFGAGAVVVGNITIGSDVHVGPNCTVTMNIPSNRTVFVPPPRVLPREIASGSSVEQASSNTRKEQQL
jgi:serine O-acetyltransferase